MARKTIEERIEQAQQLGQDRWNAMIRREEGKLRRELKAAEIKAQARRRRMHIVR